MSLILTLVSGLCWTIVYIEGIRLGFREKTYAMPLWALALNFFWEIFNSILGYAEVGFDAQVVINIVWAICDVFLVVTFFRYGYRYAKKYLSFKSFIFGSLLVFAVAAVVEYAFIMEFGLAHGRAYAAFLQNLLMSVLFIKMFIDRRGDEGQSLIIAVGKWIGTLAPTILFGLIGGGGLPGPNTFLLIVGLLCSLFDIVYILLAAGKLEIFARSQ
ncbi:hypothetical protein CCR94_12035 [Rhodoblastus sphagnicola]|uniref:Uncharacterized protein n=1 Tax=Rhodoblastus sphagnicola TaxID=333368 RepID=A0A2S6N7P0_9HYPH|nr:hypothetical protein CCR94_12035 [Rhodoblastus sphagnicola]